MPFLNKLFGSSKASNYQTFNDEKEEKEVKQPDSPVKAIKESAKTIATSKKDLKKQSINNLKAEKAKILENIKNVRNKIANIDINSALGKRGVGDEASYKEYNSRLVSLNENLKFIDQNLAKRGDNSAGIYL